MSPCCKAGSEERICSPYQSAAVAPLKVCPKMGVAKTNFISLLCHMDNSLFPLRKSIDSRLTGGGALIDYQIDPGLHRPTCLGPNTGLSPPGDPARKLWLRRVDVGGVAKPPLRAVGCLGTGGVLERASFGGASARRGGEQDFSAGACLASASGWASPSLGWVWVPTRWDGKPRGVSTFFTASTPYLKPKTAVCVCGGEEVVCSWIQEEVLPQSVEEHI